jgi:glutaminyl-tRNA synthetase
MVEAKNSLMKERLLAIGIEPKTVDNIIKNDKVVANFEQVLDMAGVKECPKEKGNLLYALTTKGKNLHKEVLPVFVKMIVENKWSRIQQIDAGVDFITEKNQKVGKDYRVTDSELASFEAFTGVGVVVTPEQIDQFVGQAFKDKADQIEAKKHDFNFSGLMTAIRDQHKWADGALVLAAINKKKLELLGEPPASDGTRKKNNKMSTEDKKKAKEEKKTEDEPTIDITTLIGRDVDVGNTSEILAKHRAATGGKVVTRFPPEPNGYLHIGHAKAIRFNFEVAKQYGGYTYLRYDDTNPDKECKEYIDHIAEIVGWLGYKPIATTASSDYFQELYDIAVRLIKKGLAYVCFQNKEDMSHYRENKLNPPTRDHSVEWNLKEFEKMRTGQYEEGKATLRCKIDMQHDNPNMRDFVAYRIKYTPHPHSGDQWCIYPTYDYTHCLCDSIENITHSLCTLEFEIRRESYYWLLKAADMYQPFVWEYSRLNITNTVLSKRKIEKLISNGLVTGWNDPRLHTV